MLYQLKGTRENVYFFSNHKMSAWEVRNELDWCDYGSSDQDSWYEAVEHGEFKSVTSLSEVPEEYYDYYPYGEDNPHPCKSIKEILNDQK